MAISLLPTWASGSLVVEVGGPKGTSQPGQMTLEQLFLIGLTLGTDLQLISVVNRPGLSKWWVRSLDMKMISE